MRGKESPLRKAIAKTHRFKENAGYTTIHAFADAEQPLGRKYRGGLLERRSLQTLLEDQDLYGPEERQIDGAGVERSKDESCIRATNHATWLQLNAPP
jgi:hypothetical protein